MLCSYCKVLSFQQNPICELDNECCFKVRPCTAEMCWKQFGNINKCKKIKENKTMKLFKNEYKVRFVKNNNLYIEIPEENRVITLDNIYDFEPNKVKLTKIKNDFYLADFHIGNEKIKTDNKK